MVGILTLESLTQTKWYTPPLEINFVALTYEMKRHLGTVELLFHYKYSSLEIEI